MLTDLRTWQASRRRIATGVALAAFALLVLASGIVNVADGALSLPGPWWASAAAAAGAILIGLIGASYVGTPIGADATLCDTRWPVLGLIALYLASDLRTAVPLITGIARPAITIAAIALLVWALLERLRSERRAVADDGEVCTTCRPVFPRASGRS
ncbi:MAG: hypothetical protein ABIX44_04950 [Cryobacterium sp.]